MGGPAETATVGPMTDLYFDTAVLTSTGVTAEGRNRTFAELGLKPGERLVLSARKLTLGVPAPADRDLFLSADTLVPIMPLKYVDNGFLPRIEIFAQDIQGTLNVSCQGRTGATGMAGAKGA